MTQSQQPSERKFIAVHFRGIQPLSRERTTISIAGPAGLEVLAALAEGWPAPDEVEPDTSPRPPLSATGELAFGLGGEGARAAYAYGALGGVAHFAGTLGDDAAGDLVLSWLAGRGVETGMVSRRGRTPVTVLAAARGYQAVAVTGAPGGDAAGEVRAGDHTTRSGRGDPAAALGQGSGTFLLAGYPYGSRGEESARLLEEARRRGMQTALSLSPVALGGPGAPLMPADLEQVLPHVDIICGGVAELRRATRRADPQEAARALIAGGAQRVLAKRGAAGASLFRLGPAALEREDMTVTAPSALAAAHPLRAAAALGGVYDAAFLLGTALNDANPARFATEAANRVVQSSQGVLGL